MGFLQKIKYRAPPTRRKLNSREGERVPFVLEMNAFDLEFQHASIADEGGYLFHVLHTRRTFDAR